MRAEALRGWGRWAAAGLVAAGLAGSARAQDEADLALVEARSAELVEVMAAVRPAFVFIGGGSGVLISPDGLMLTNHHVAGSRSTWPVYSPGGKRYTARVLGQDPRGDLSLLKLEGDGPFPFVEFGNSDEAAPGQTVFAVGNPIGIGYDDYSPTFTRGVISVVNRNHANYTDCIQTDAPINPGNSGGPLFDLEGRLLGINGMIQTRFQRRVNSGVGYAISVEQVKLWVPRLKEAGGGVVPHATTSGLRIRRGVTSATLARSSGAARAAGLEAGDVILAIDGRPVRNSARFAGIIGMYPAGAEVELRYRRGEREAAVRLTLEGEAERPAVAAAAERPYLGCMLRRGGGSSIVLGEVVASGPLAKAGAREGDRIVSWEGEALEGVADLLARLGRAKVGQTVTLRVARGDEELSLEVELAARPSR